MKKPYFSIIIPCLNEEHFLPNLLKNLNSQTFKDFEVIIIDGNSEDKTAKVATEFSTKYPLHLYSTTTRNVAFQRNLGAEKATGKILIFFDADTQIPKNYLKKIAQTFEKRHPHFLTTYINVDSKKPAEVMFAFFSNLIFETGKVFKVPFSFGAMQAVKKGAFFDVGGYDTNTKFAEDSQLFQNLYDYNYKFVMLPTPRYIFSLRRLRSEGVLKSLTQYLQLNLNILLRGYHVPPKVLYQMGGQQYDIKKIENVKYSQIFKPFFLKLRKAIKKQNKDAQSIINKIFSSN
jgi:glycosyltransferase involved in cell wall biosynthesis